jgi:hypothetical protein
MAPSRTRLHRLRTTAAHLCSQAATATTRSSGGPKIYISVDIEGIGNVVNDEQMGPGGMEYEQARRWMTDEAVGAAR